MKKIQLFDDFTGDNKFTLINRKMRAIVEELNERGVSIKGDVEDPTYESDGLIELSEKVAVLVQLNGMMTGSVELPEGSSVFTEQSRDLSKVLKDITSLKIRHKMHESNYTTNFKNTKPTDKTKDLLEKRANSIAKAAEHIKNAVSELKTAPKLDEYQDIPELITGLEKILERDSNNIIGLSEMYSQDLKG